MRKQGGDGEPVLCSEAQRFEGVPAEVEEAVGDVETRRRELEHAPEDLRYLGEGAAVSDFTTRFVDTRRAS